ncbi:SgcJ/EcaC family oxidoreductase [Pedobacter immunditicola]|uniref:SgcJ/EcaC family oxidoreductase n=1 Tax=Pedobacter immunditicola TaxID=3133440 RepID=UPI0030AB3DEE
MKTIKLLIFSLLICFTAVGQSADDEQQLKDIIQKLENQWNKDDFSFFTDETYMPDAILINPLGAVWNGQAEIEKGIAVVKDIILKNFSTKYTVKNIRFMAPSVALVIVHAADQTERDVYFPDGTKGDTKGHKREGMAIHTFVKQNDVWRIACTQATPVITDGPIAKIASKGD